MEKICELFRNSSNLQREIDRLKEIIDNIMKSGDICWTDSVVFDIIEYNLKE